MQARLVVVGGSGTIGRILTDAWGPGSAAVVVDPRPPSSDGPMWVRHAAADVPEGTLEAGDVVVFAATGQGGGWGSLLATEIVGLRHVALQATEAGVARFVLLSSSRVAFGAEREIAASAYRSWSLPSGTLRTDTVRPLDDYGAVKAFAEGYLRMLAESRGLRSSVLRIGTVRAVDDPQGLLDEGIPDMPMDREVLARRLSATWLSHDDLLRIVQEEIAAPETFRRRFAVSATTERTWFPDEVETWTR